MQYPDADTSDGPLKVKVTAPAEGGRANAAVIKLLAKRWKLAKGRFSLVSGAASRQKVIEIIEADQALLDKILTIEETGRQSARQGDMS